MIPLITAQTIAFWVLAPLAVVGALGMVVSRKPVHSAICLAGMMVALGCLYASLDAPFLFVAQIIVYTGAVMMLFLFTMMIVGIDSVDSLVETLRGQRVAAAVLVLAFGALLIVAVGHGIVADPVGLGQANSGGNVQGVAQIVFGSYAFAFEATSALLITAALAAIVLAHGERLTKPETQRERMSRRVRDFMEGGADPGPLPSPGIYARHNSIDYPALLPDGSVSDKSVSPTLAVRGVAVVDNDGLRAAHLAAITTFVAVHDEAAGTELAAEVAKGLDDGQPPELTAGGSAQNTEERPR